MKHSPVKLPLPLCLCIVVVYIPEAMSCVKAYWNDNFLHKVGYSSYCSRPVQKAALLDCKDTLFTLCGRKPDWGELHRSA